MDQIAHAIHESRDVDGLRFKILAPREREQPLYKSARTLGCLQRAADALGRPLVAIRFAPQVVESAHDRGE